MKKTFSVLDGMRGIAAIYVLIIHTGSFWGNLDFHHSYLAVDLFFLLSGFVIAHAYEAKLDSGQLSLQNFILVRLIRLYPMYFLSVIFAATIFILDYLGGRNRDLLNTHQLIELIALSLIFLPTYIPGIIYLFPLNIPYWSIFYELIMNLVYVFTREKLKNNVLIILVISLSCLLALMAYFRGDISAGLTWKLTSILSALVRSGFGIFLGVYLFRIHKRLLINLSISSWMVILIMAISLMAPDLGRLNGLFDLFAVTLIFPLLILLGVRSKHGLIADLILKKLGVVSYPMYLLHIPVSLIIYRYASDLVEIYAPYSGVSLVLGLMILSLLAEKYLDIPARRFLTKCFVKPNLKYNQKNAVAS